MIFCKGWTSTDILEQGSVCPQTSYHSLISTVKSRLVPLKESLAPPTDNFLAMSCSWWSLCTILMHFMLSRCLCQVGVLLLYTVIDYIFLRMGVVNGKLSVLKTFVMIYSQLQKTLLGNFGSRNLIKRLAWNLTKNKLENLTKPYHLFIFHRISWLLCMALLIWT